MKNPSDIYHSFVREPGFRPSPTFMAADKAKAMVLQDPAAINLTLGELDISPSDAQIEEWKAEAAEKVAHGAPDAELYKLFRKTGKGMNYPPMLGTTELRRVAAKKFSEQTHIDGVDVSNVIVHSGGKGVLNLIGHQFAAGDEVLIAAPGWPTNREIWSNGVKVSEVDTDGRGLMTPEVLRAALDAHPHVLAVLINDPCNPTGARYNPGEREEIMQVLKEFRDRQIENGDAGLIAVLDDPYGGLTYKNATMQRGDNERSLFNDGGIAVVNSVSKVYGKPDLGVGWLVTKNKQLLENIPHEIATIRQITDEVQNAAQLLLLFGDKFAEETKARMESRGKKLTGMVNQIPGLHMDEPDGTIYGWINCKALKGKKWNDKTIETPAQVAEFLRKDARVGLVDGGPFYHEGSPLVNQKGWFLRAMLSDEKILETACGRIKEAVGKLQEPQRNWGATTAGDPLSNPGFISPA